MYIIYICIFIFHYKMKPFEDWYILQTGIGYTDCPVEVLYHVYRNANFGKLGSTRSGEYIFETYLKFKIGDLYFLKLILVQCSPCSVSNTYFKECFMICFGHSVLTVSSAIYNCGGAFLRYCICLLLFLTLCWEEKFWKIICKGNWLVKFWLSGWF